MREQKAGGSAGETSSAEGTTIEESGASATKFTKHGAIPPVTSGGGADEQSASERAYKDGGANSAVVGSAIKAILMEDNAGLDAAGMKKKFDKLKTSPFVFFRGTGALFYRDLKGVDKKLPEVVSDGDIHPENFGIIEGKDGTLFFGPNDFDESSKAPFSWDVKRGATAFELAARDKGIPEDKCAEIVKAFVQGYSQTISTFIGNSHEDKQQITEDNAKHYGKIVADMLDKQSSKSDDKKRKKFIDDLVNPATQKFLDSDEVKPCSSRLGEFQSALGKYAGAHGFAASDIKDVAMKLDSGTASLGSERYYILVGNAKDPELDRILEVKEEGPSVMEKGGIAREGRSPADRVVTNEQTLSPDGDPYYGSATLKDKSFVVRERNPHKDALKLDKTKIGDGKDDDYSVKDFEDYAYSCGAALAQAHARTGKTDGEAAEKRIDKALDKDLKAEIEQFAVSEADRVTAQWKAFAATK